MTGGSRIRTCRSRSWARPVAEPDGSPVLWHIPVSHYSEKARWALQIKGVEHKRRAPPPGGHMLVALALTRGRSVTFPVLELDGRRIGDSTAIIAALEERHPEPPLYPEDPADRRRALELEEFFDARLGPAIRRLGWHEVAQDRDRMAAVAVRQVPQPMARFRGPVGAFGRTYVNLRYSAADPEGAERARRDVLASLDRLDAELGDREYLVGDRFTSADLTAAALFYPLVLPPEGPRAFDPTEAYERFRAPLKERRGYRWVQEMFRRHRRG